MTPAEASDLIKRFVVGDVGPWKWDDFVSLKHKNPIVDAAGQEAAATRNAVPATSPNTWCSEAGLQALISIAQRLESAT